MAPIIHKGAGNVLPGPLAVSNHTCYRNLLSEVSISASDLDVTGANVDDLDIVFFIGGHIGHLLLRKQQAQ